MLNEPAQKLVDALRSGKYTQTQGTLRDKTGHCCLGVACELAVEAGVIPPCEYEPEFDRFWYDGMCSVLPEKVAKWLGFASNDGYLGINNSHYHSLTSLNDNGRTFSEIADVIEKSPGHLFGDINTQAPDLSNVPESPEPLQLNP